MLYDRHEMQPLFRLSIGNPGSSFAVEIARKIGLPEEVIAHASEIVGSEYINMDKYLLDIARDKRYWERKRDEIRRERKRLDEAATKYETDLEVIAKQKKEILAAARQQAEQLLAESNARIEQTIREIKEAKAEREATLKVRNELKGFREQLGDGDSEEAKEASERVDRLQSPRKKVKKKATVPSVKQLPGKRYSPGWGMLSA